MAYGEPRAILSDGAIRCIDCAIVKFTSVKEDEIDNETRDLFIENVERDTAYYGKHAELTVVLEGQNQDFLVDAYCEDCDKDLEATCSDY